MVPTPDIDPMPTNNRRAGDAPSGRASGDAPRSSRRRAQAGGHSSAGRTSAGNARTNKAAAAAFHRRRQERFNVLRIAVASVAALVVGCALGLLLYPILPIPGSPAVVVGQTTVPESGLDSPMGTYTYNGKEITVTVREAIEDTSKLDAAKNSDGTYDVPSADAVLSIARNRILLEDAAERGITANDDDALAYAKDILGTDDLKVVAANYNMDTDQVKELMRNSAVLKKLRDEVVVSKDMAEPKAPKTAEAGQEDTPNAEYATYILELVGDEWDANANTWAREDGPYREALRDYTIANDSATYSAAQAAYYVAYTQYSAVQQQISSEWTAYVNEKLAGVTVQLGTLVA